MACRVGPLIALLVALAEEEWNSFDRLLEWPAWAQATALSMMLLCLEIFAVVDDAIPFVYFQF